MIELINISKIYGTRLHTVEALKNVSLSVPKGEIFGVIGQSGAGKSTLLRCVNLLERPTSGIVRVDGIDLLNQSFDELRDIRRHISMIFQHFNLLNESTVYQNIALPLKLIHKNKREIEETVMPLLDLVGLQDKKNSYPKALSGGQKQRVAIARALASRPKVLLCDEATSALDPKTTQSILSLLKKINQTFGLTIMLITHDAEVVKQICDHVAFMHAGELIEQNDVYQFFTNPHTTIAQDFVKLSMKQTLPDALSAAIHAVPEANDAPLLRLIFHGHAASAPLVAYLMQELKIKMNILQANIEYLKNDPLGIMVAQIDATEAQLNAGITYLKQQNVHAEVIGYVKRTL